MAETKPRKRLSVLKRIRQTAKRSLRHKGVRTQVRTYTKRFLAAVKGGEKDTVDSLLKSVSRVIDMAASKGVLHKNTASRKISRLAKKAAALKS